MPERAPAELTLRAIALGLGLGVLLAAANVYAGLKLGFVDVGTTTVVLVGFAVLGHGRRPLTPQEANVAQVAGSSAGAMAVTAGLIGPIPALALTGHPVSPAVIIVWATALAGFGTLVAIPFRDQLIGGRGLVFPSARAAGELIRSLFVAGGSERGAVRLLAVAALAAAALTVARDALDLIPGGWMLPLAIAGIPAAQLSIGVAASPLLVGVGLLVGARVGLSMLLGAAIAWLGVAPVLVGRGLATAGYPSLVSWTLWPGAALMVASSLTRLVLGRRELWRASPGQAARLPAARRVLAAIAAVATALVLVAWAGFGIHPVLGAASVALAAACSAAAMHATGETDHTPAGPLGGLTQIALGALGPGGTTVPLHGGGIVNGAAVHAAAMMNAWKSGDVVGGCSPARLIAAQLAGIVVGATAGVVAYWLVREAYGLGTALMPAPGALSWRATALAVAGGTASMPAGAPLAALAGAIAGVALAIVDRRPRLARWAPSAVAIGVGFIEPASITITAAVAAIGFAAVAARAPTWHQRSAPALAAGLIVGEAFTGVVVAAILVARGA